MPLLVENVQPIVWNKAAFDSLAAPDDTKMLITALITNKIKSTESMDFVQGKGTGLIVLLHGCVMPSAFRQDEDLADEYTEDLALARHSPRRGKVSGSLSQGHWSNIADVEKRRRACGEASLPSQLW